MNINLSSAHFKIVFFLFVMGISFVLSGLYLNINFYKNRIYPNTTIDNIDVSGLTTSEAIKKLTKNSKSVNFHELKISVDDIQKSSSSAELNAFRDYSQATNIAYENTRSKEKLENVLNLTKSFFSKNDIITQIWYEEEKLDVLIDNLSKDVNIEGKNPNISLKISGNPQSIVIFKGTPGRTINTTDTKEKIRTQVNNSALKNNFLIKATVASTSAVLSDTQIELEISRAKKLVGKTLSLKAENKLYQLNDIKLISLLKPLDGYREKEIDKLILGWSEDINRNFQNAEFDVDKNSLKVKSFKPHRDGLEVDKIATKKEIINWLKKLENNDSDDTDITINDEMSVLEIPLNKTKPEISLKDTNDLGINEKIGFGESYFYHSTINRVHNVGITSDRISLTIVPPGEEFSFNKTLGDVSARTGFRSAYVISGGKTILGDGGGVCQVSSTLFRSILDAGLKVSKRLQHSYRVSYYELNSQPGFDATVYSGNVDFRFVNDTNAHILIYAHTDLDNRYMNIEIYGTNDGRTTEISNYKKWDFRKAPSPQYYPTSDLPTGVTKQVDWSVAGIKTEFTHIIKNKDGNVTNKETYYSNYRPWSAKYMVGI